MNSLFLAGKEFARNAPKLLGFPGEAKTLDRAKMTKFPVNSLLPAIGKAKQVSAGSETGRPDQWQVRS